MNLKGLMKISFIEDRANHLVLFAKVLFFKRSIFEFSVAETLLLSFHFVSNPDLVFYFFWFLFHWAVEIISSFLHFRTLFACKFLQRAFFIQD